eukprot:9555480-Alexandrium_andersonii.AAC.1
MQFQLALLPKIAHALGAELTLGAAAVHAGPQMRPLSLLVSGTVQVSAEAPFVARHKLWQAPVSYTHLRAHETSAHL